MVNKVDGGVVNTTMGVLHLNRVACPPEGVKLGNPFNKDAGTKKRRRE